MFIAHFVADWIVQSVETGREKSSNILVLLYHIFQIFAVTVCVGAFQLDAKLAIYLAALNAFTHLIIDGVIWKLYKLTVRLRNYKTPKEELEKNFKYWLDPVFGWTLGFDQCLHFLFIYLIYSPYLES